MIVLRNGNFLLGLFCFTSSFVNSQVIRHPAIPFGSCQNCNSEQDWNHITNKKLLKASPFNKILHLSFKHKNDFNYYGTASFVSTNLLVTARHCVDWQEYLEHIELRLPSTNKWLKLKKNDYKIYYYTDRFNKRENDVALIKVVNKQKLKLLYHGHFEIADTPNITSHEDVNVSGFPLNKFAIDSAAPDTLVSRKVSSNLRVFNASNTLIGHPACTCNGDSGGPIWIRRGTTYLIVGVNQGSKSKEAGFTDPNLNIGVYISDNVVKWIRTIKKVSL